MDSKVAKLLDQSGKVVATAQVAERGEHFAGTIDLDSMPDDVRQKFEEYDDIVNGQVFSLLDEIEEQISGLSLKLVIDGIETPIEDLQIYPSTGRVSFKIMSEAAPQRP